MSKRLAPETAPYLALLAESTRHDLPKRFKSDVLKHDRAWLSGRDPKEPFVWVVGEHGSSINALDARDIHGPLFPRILPRLVDTFDGSDLGHSTRIYFWDGVALHYMATVDHARARIEQAIEALNTDRARAV